MDPDLQIRGGGGSHLDPEIRVGAQSPKNIFFQPFGPQFGLKIRGGRGPPGPSPRSATDRRHVSHVNSQTL